MPKPPLPSRDKLLALDRASDSISDLDYYDRLGISRDADDTTIKKAYRTLALKHHPDKGGDADVFKLYAEAYAVLSSPEKRRIYDATGEASLVDLDIDGMMSECFAEGGWFEQMVKDDPLMAEMMEEEGMAGMQKSFGSFFAAAMGGGGPVYLPDGTQVDDMPRIKMPSLAELMADATGEDRELMERVQKKMGIGARGALVPGTGMQAMEILRTAGTDPHFWSDDDDDEDEDAWLDDLQNGLQAKSGKCGGGKAVAAAKKPPAKSPAAPRTVYASVNAKPSNGSSSSSAAAAAEKEGETRDDGEGDDEDAGVLVPCTAPAAIGKLWLDAARQGRMNELMSLARDEPTLIHYVGVGLGQTALHWACTKGEVRIVEWLIAQGAPIEVRNASGARALHAASAAGEARCVFLLLNAKARTHVRDEEGKTPERAARERGHLDVVSLLTGGDGTGTGTGGDDVEVSQRIGGGIGGGLGGVSASEARKAAKALLEQRAADSSNGGNEGGSTNPILEAAASGDASALSSALNSLTDLDARRHAAEAVDTSGLSALHLACRSGNPQCVTDLLLNAKADGALLTTKGNTPLAIAAKHCKWDAVSALLDGGVMADGLATLQAVRRGAPDALQMRLAVDAGGLAAIDPPAAGGRSALMAAAAAGEESSVARLLELNADVDLADANYATALHYCADKGSVQCARLLIASGAYLGALDTHGNTCLHAAGRRGHAKLFNALVEAGADGEALNDRGRAPKLLDAADADAACAVM